MDKKFNKQKIAFTVLIIDKRKLINFFRLLNSMPFYKFMDENSIQNKSFNENNRLIEDVKTITTENDNEIFNNNICGNNFQNFKLNQLENFHSIYKFLENKKSPEYFNTFNSPFKINNKSDCNFLINSLLKNPPSLVVKYDIIPDKIIIIHDSSNIYSNTYQKMFVYNGIKYTSVYQIYQHYKLKELCNKEMEEAFFTHKSIKLYSEYVQKCLKLCQKTKKDVYKWRQIKGLQITTQATVEKFRQNKDLLNKMKNDRDKLILNAYKEDTFDGCGSIEILYQWLNKNRFKSINVPVYEEPICLENYPTIGRGKNIQGLIVMLARSILNENGFF
uniref:Evolutionarily conserved signaling intermediate in Toll pathway, mitochondrial n=1 Tax=Strongyloides stercoralis TaxID=6248 RepID=A0AAF5DGC6_STRER